MTPAQTGRAAWTIASILAVESFVFGLSVLPAFYFWTWTLTWAILDFPFLRPAIVATTLVPAYVVFAIAFAWLSALSTRVFGWRTKPGALLKLRDLEWPLLDWVRYLTWTRFSVRQRTWRSASSEVEFFPCPWKCVLRRMSCCGV